MSLQHEGNKPGAAVSDPGDTSSLPRSKKRRNRRGRNRNRDAREGSTQVESVTSDTDGKSTPETVGHRGAEKSTNSKIQAGPSKGPATPNNDLSPKRGRGGRNRRRNGSQPDQRSSNRGGSAAQRARQENQPVQRGIYSAIDLGTNNCRLLIARPTRHGFRVIDAFSRIVRLGEGVSTSGVLSEAAMDRTIEALKVCSEKLARRNVTCMRHVATEACRVAGNTDEFIARVKAETGINLDVITAGEEARLAVMGCQSLIAQGNQYALVFDIGGGSTELIWVRVRKRQATEIHGWVSIPWGVVNLTERHGVMGGTVSPEQYAAMVNEVSGPLQSFDEARQISELVKKRRTQFLGTSGTVTTLASLHLQLPRYIRDKVDGAWMKTRDIKELSNQVAHMTHLERTEQPCIGRERADLVVAGCAILEAILGTWNVPSLRVADRGIREGILRGLMQIEKPPRRAEKRQGQYDG